MNKLTSFLFALLCATITWAQTNVSTDQELRNAIADNANIKLTADIDLSNSTLSIPEGTTVTIDLGGHTLNRGLTKREWNTGGQVITVCQYATLNLSNGTLTGGWGGASGGISNENATANLTNVNIIGCVGDDHGGGICNKGGSMLVMTGGSITGCTSKDVKVKDTDRAGGGGIFNAQGARAILTGVTITGNTATIYGGGGICNYGIMTLDSCTITGNSCKMNGGGIWQSSYGKGMLELQGKITVTDNTSSGGIKNNIFLKTDAIISITGSLAGSGIGINMETPGVFTKSYKASNDGTDPATIFKADNEGVMGITLANNEVKLSRALPEGSSYYIERSWDKENKKVVAHNVILSKGEYTLLTKQHYNGDLVLSDGTYVVGGKDAGEFFASGAIKITGDTKIVLCDDAILTANKAFIVEPSATLNVYGQLNNSGVMRNWADTGDDNYYPGIGTYDGTGTTINFHGGTIRVKSSGARGAGIGDYTDGNKASDTFPTINIYGGNITAQGANSEYNYRDHYGDIHTEYHGSPGIGSHYRYAAGEINIYGGKVNAKGGDDVPGIGTGYVTAGHTNQGTCTITFYGGEVYAYGGEDGPGICGDNIGKTVIFNGGHVEAYGGKNGAGIGGGSEAKGSHVTVNGGEVYAYGGDDGAGIGGGWDADGGSLTVNEGYVYAKGNGNGAGIGSGSEALLSGGKQGGSLTVTGGKVEAYGGEDAAGIGGGEDADGGTVNISGGYVYAKGSYGGAGIGGGEGGDGGNVTITGGTVHASAGEGGTGNRAIGPGKGDDVYGKLTIGDEMMVTSERLATAAERKNMCWYRTDVHVEPCIHQDHTYTLSGTTKNDTHTEVCQYCTTAFEPEQHTFEGGICTVCGVEQTFGGGGTGVETMSDERGKMSDDWYDLQGRKMVNGKLPKGLYIHNGKKIVIGTK